MVSYVIVFSAVPDFRATCKAHLRRNAALFRRCQLRADVHTAPQTSTWPLRSLPSAGPGQSLPLSGRPVLPLASQAQLHLTPSRAVTLRSPRARGDLGARFLCGALCGQRPLRRASASVALRRCRCQAFPSPSLTLTFLSSLPSSQALVAVMISMCLARTVAPWPFSVCWDFSNRLSSLSRH